MGLASSFYAFMVLFHLLLLLLLLLRLAEAAAEDEPSCPLSFDCGKHGPISFPFANNRYSRCGLATVNCDDERQFPSITLGKKQFDVVQYQWLKEGTIILHDPELPYQINPENCDYLLNFSLPNFSSSLRFDILAYLLKCLQHQHPKNEQQRDAYFNFSAYQNSTKCSGHILYYKYPYNLASIPNRLPDNCSFIQLPIRPPYEYRHNEDIFNLLIAEFTLQVNVADACNVCQQRGGRCLHESENNLHWCVRKKGDKRNLAIRLGAGASAAGMVIAIVLFYYINRKYSSIWKIKNENPLDVESFLRNCGSLAPIRYSYSDVKKMTNTFKERLGQGGYGGVYKGKLHNGCLVAVKLLSESKGNGEEFINEVASIGRTSHVNIVTLLGFCYEGRKRALIYEFMPNGSLEKFIYKEKLSKECQLGWETLYKIAVGIAEGLEYLHRGCNTRILHFDIKPHNILLDENFCPKISDFGLAKLCPEKDSTISILGTRGTVGFIAPEVFSRNFGVVSHKSDVYSYGMVILEMVGGRKNIDVEVDNTSEIYFPHWIYRRFELNEEIELHGIGNQKDNENARKMIIVGLWCIQTDPINRPPVSSVMDMLKGSLESLQIPPKPFLSSPPSAPADSTTT